ncbi:MAG: formyltetrahydrofolate deformylase [Bradymonadia bacterium]|jgi:formyltetrahydrofolate deformylase
MSTAILLAHCPDQPGLVAAVAHWIQSNGGNVLDLEQHVAEDLNTFFLRAEWEYAGQAGTIESLREAFKADVGDRFSMSWRMADRDFRPRAALFVSKQSHCLFDLLSRAHAGELPAEIGLVISNHRKLEPVVNRFEIPFSHVPVTSDTKPAAEAAARQLLAEHDINFVVLARYMQVLSAEFVSDWEGRIINIHHSFLPAFPGARPYHQAHTRGVKIIGATSHYVTAELDQGPIIAQDVVAVSHRDGPKDLVRKGRDVEKIVLARAVRAHAERRVLWFNNRTVVFGT